MGQIYYWQGILGYNEAFEPYKAHIELLLRGEYQRLKIERLGGSAEAPLYSMRTDLKTRLLFTTQHGSVFLLDVVENHDYHKSKFYKNPRLASAFANAETLENPPELTEPELQKLIGDGFSEPTSYRYFQNNFICFSPEQKEAVATPLPAIVYGPAGAGKTCVAVEMLLAHVNAHRAERDAFPIVYVSQSAALVQEIKRLWDEATMDDASLHNLVLFKTYEELLKERLEEGLQIAADEDTFHEWYHKKKKRPLSLEVMWREFRILSGYELDEYKALGKRQSGIDDNQRAQVQDCYNGYQDFLKQKN